MKNLLAILIVLFSILLVSCNAYTQTPTDIPTDPKASESASVEHTEKTTENNDDLIKNMKDLEKLEDVISVERLSFSTSVDYAVAYKMIFTSDELKIAADIVLPKDYVANGAKYPVMFYFPTVEAPIEHLALSYAAKGISVVRMYERGFGDSEGARDLGGEDLADAQKLIQICDRAEFIKNSKMFVTGASSGSIIAMRLIAEDSAKRLSGCAVSDVISDMKSYADFRGEKIQSLFSAALSGAYDEIPEEYEKRSALNFYEKLDRPLLMIHYEQSPFCQAEQTERLYELVHSNNSACYYKKFDIVTSDFTNEGLASLLEFIGIYGK